MRTFVASSEPEGSHGADDAEDIVGEDGQDLSQRGIRTMQSEAGSRGCDNLLLLCAGKLSKYS